MNFNQREGKPLVCAVITAGETAQSTEVYSEGRPDRNGFLMIPLLELLIRVVGWGKEPHSNIKLLGYCPFLVQPTVPSLHSPRQCPQGWTYPSEQDRLLLFSGREKPGDRQGKASSLPWQLNCRDT